MKYLLFNTIVLCFMVTQLLLGGEIDVQKAISIIKKKESGIQSLEWSCSVERQFIGKGEKSSGTSHVYLDKQGCFRINKAAIVPWLEGITPFLYNEQLATFDGKIFRSEKTSQGLHSETENIQREKKISNIPEGLVSKGYDVANGEVNWRGSPEGIGYFFPYTSAWDGVEDLPTYPATSFSDALQKLVKQKKIIKVFEDNNGIWSIIYPFFLIPEKNIQIFCRVRYDPGKGSSGTILSVSRGTEQDLDDDHLIPMITFEYQQINDFFVPKKIKILIDLGLDRQPLVYDIYHFTDVKINEKLFSSDFQIDWQKGTNVYDHVAKKFYVVTDDPLDEAEAVRAFKNLYELSPSSPFENNFRVTIIRFIMIGIGLSLIIYGLYLHFKKKKK